MAEDFLRHVEIKEGYGPAAQGPPALHFLLDNPFAKQDAWVSLEEPSSQRVSFGPATVSLRTVASDAEAKSAPAPSGGNEVAFLLTPAGALHYVIGTRTGPGPRIPGADVRPSRGLAVVAGAHGRPRRRRRGR